MQVKDWQIQQAKQPEVCAYEKSFKLLNPSLLQGLHEPKLPFVSRIENIRCNFCFICSCNLELDHWRYDPDMRSPEAAEDGCSPLVFLVFPSACLCCQILSTSVNPCCQGQPQSCCFSESFQTMMFNFVYVQLLTHIICHCLVQCSMVLRTGR